MPYKGVDIFLVTKRLKDMRTTDPIRTMWLSFSGQKQLCKVGGYLLLVLHPVGRRIKHCNIRGVYTFHVIMCFKDVRTTNPI